MGLLAFRMALLSGEVETAATASTKSSGENGFRMALLSGEVETEQFQPINAD